MNETIFFNATNISNIIFKESVNEFDIIKDYCIYSFQNFNEKIILLCILILLYELFNFLQLKYKIFETINKSFETVLFFGLKIFTLYLGYIIIIKYYNNYYYIVKIIFFIFLILSVFLLYWNKDKIKKFINIGSLSK